LLWGGGCARQPFKYGFDAFTRLRGGRAQGRNVVFA
jgi:hypothetical protein